jgi:hypothetical protein
MPKPTIISRRKPVFVRIVDVHAKQVHEDGDRQKIQHAAGQCGQSAPPRHEQRREGRAKNPDTPYRRMPRAAEHRVAHDRGPRSPREAIGKRSESLLTLSGPDKLHGERVGDFLRVGKDQPRASRDSRNQQHRPGGAAVSLREANLPARDKQERCRGEERHEGRDLDGAGGGARQDRQRSGERAAPRIDPGRGVYGRNVGHAGKQRRRFDHERAGPENVEWARPEEREKHRAMAPRDVERAQHVPQRREPASKRRHRDCPARRLDRTAGCPAYFRHQPLIHRPFERPLPGRTENGGAIAPERAAAEHFLNADGGVALPPSVYVEDAVVPADVESPAAENRRNSAERPGGGLSRFEALVQVLI